MRRFEILPAPRQVTYDDIVYPYVVTAKGAVINKLNRALSPTDSNGYDSLTLCDRSKQKSVMVNRVVAFAFVPNSDPVTRRVVDHIDGNKRNNHYKNLRWVTQKENCQSATASNGHRGGTPKVEVDQLDVNGNFIAHYPSMAAAELATGASRGGIRESHEGIANHCVGFKWFIYENKEGIVTVEELAMMKPVPIEGFEQYYVSRTGQIVTTKSKRSANWRYMKIKIEDSGYSVIQFSKGKTTKNFKIHKLVALCYLPTPRPDQTQVNHKNKRRSDNRLENLEWVSPSENMRHAFTYREEATTN